MKLYCPVLILFLLSLSGFATEYYVAVNGDDKNAGTSEKPFQSLEAARAAVRRRLKEAPNTPVTVWLLGGTYSRLSPFQLTSEDSGTAAAPVRYRAVEGQEVRLTGGRDIPAAAFKAVTDEVVLSRLDPVSRGHVLQADLKALGIGDFGTLRSRGFGRSTQPSALELFFGDKPMTLTRWPNDDWAIIGDAPAGAAGLKFNYQGDRPKRWTKADDVWIHGYWTYDWSDSYEKVQNIDLDKHEIAIVPPQVPFGFTKGKRYFALNILEELDAPGEWYLDRQSGVLYFWPPAPLESGRIMVSISSKPLLEMKNVSYVGFQGITFEGGRVDGIHIDGGTNNLIGGCTIRNFGNTAVTISGEKNGVAGCEIYAADGGIYLGGGDRKTLTNGGNFATNNNIHHYNRWCMVYHPGITLDGCGNRAANNWIHDAPHNGILMSGNEHIVELNEINNVCTETGDSGAFYIGRDWSMRGNVVRYNYFHDLEGVQGQKGFVDVMAVYLDDAASGTTVFGNICYKVRRAIMVGGGRDNIVENNVFVDCKIAIHIDARGMSWAKNHIALERGDWGMKKKLEDVRWNQPPYSVKYPQLANMLEQEPAFPKGTVVTRNISAGSKFLELQDKLNDKTITIKDNFADGDPGFVDAAKQNFQLRDDAAPLKSGFQRIPVEKIGLYKDEFRNDLPIRK